MRNGSRLTDPLFLAGWLFADLLLAMAIIFLVSTPGLPASADDATPTPTPTPTATPRPLPTATPIPPPTPTPLPACQRSVNLVKTERTAPNAPGGGVPSVEQLRAVPWNFGGNVAGLVLTYVHAPGVGQGQGLARKVNRRLTEALPNPFPPDAVYEPFDYVDANTARQGEVSFQIFLLNETCR